MVIARGGRVEPMQQTHPPLSFFLFVEKRPRAAEKALQIRQCLNRLGGSERFELDVVDVGERPYLVEHFKLVATPALVRLSETGNQVLAGSDIVSQIEYWWPRWQQDTSAGDSLPSDALNPPEADTPVEDTGNTEATFKRDLASSDLEASETASLPKDISNSDGVSHLPETAEPRAKARPTEAILFADEVRLDAANASSVGYPSAGQSLDRLRLLDEIFQLKQANEDLEAQLEFKDRIIAMMAHDLRNPLTAASIAVETLEMGLDPERQSKVKMRPNLTMQLLKNAKSQLRAIDRMISDILKRARSTSTTLRLQPHPADLKMLCLEALDAIDAKVQAKQQTIETDIPQDLPPVYADVGQIRRLLTNLLDNAVKYTPERGVIKITALHRTTQKVQVSIQDTGPGIPDSKQGQIFEERFRLQRDQAQDGYGIGLALCQRIVQAHFGKIWVDSTPSEGSTFHFILPVYRTRSGGL